MYMQREREREFTNKAVDGKKRMHKHTYLSADGKKSCPIWGERKANTPKSNHSSTLPTTEAIMAARTRLRLMPAASC